MPRRGGPKHKPDTRDRTRAAEALRLRLSGMTWEEIAAQLGYRSPGGPRMAVERMLSRIEVEGATQLRATEGRRLDALQAAVWPKAVAGDTDAIRTVLRISERRSKLLGLDAPARVEVEGITEHEFAEMARELLEATGVRPLVEAALPALPPAERAAWVRTVEDTAHADDADVAKWSNLDIDSEPDSELLNATPQPAPDTAPAEDGPAVESAAADDDRGDDAEIEIEADVIEPDDEAEVTVPTPGRFASVRRVPGAAVWGRSANPYDPLASWRPRQTRHGDKRSRN